MWSFPHLDSLACQSIPMLQAQKEEQTPSRVEGEPSTVMLMHASSSDREFAARSGELAYAEGYMATSKAMLYWFSSSLISAVWVTQRFPLSSQ